MVRRRTYTKRRPRRRRRRRSSRGPSTRRRSSTRRRRRRRKSPTRRRRRRRRKSTTRRRRGLSNIFNQKVYRPEYDFYAGRMKTTAPLNRSIPRTTSIPTRRLSESNVFDKELRIPLLDHDDEIVGKMNPAANSLLNRYTKSDPDIYKLMRDTFSEDWHWYPPSYGGSSTASSTASLSRPSSTTSLFRDIDNLMADLEPSRQGQKSLFGDPELDEIMRNREERKRNRQDRNIDNLMQKNVDEFTKQNQQQESVRNGQGISVSIPKQTMADDHRFTPEGSNVKQSIADIEARAAQVA